MKKVLVIEDNQDMSFILRERLEGSGFSVDTAEDGYSVLKCLRNEQAPDVIIMDLMLPERSGIDLLGSLKGKWANTKIFIFTAQEEYKTKSYLFKNYICEFFCKSEGIPKLIEAIKQELGDIK